MLNKSFMVIVCGSYDIIDFFVLSISVVFQNDYKKKERKRTWWYGYGYVMIDMVWKSIQFYFHDISA